MADVETQREAILDVLDNVAKRLAEERKYLTGLDSAIGNADHDVNMERDFGKVADKREESVRVEPNEIAKNVEATLTPNVGRASGPLYDGSIMFTSQELEDGIAAEPLVVSTEMYLDKVKDRGDAQIGTKTMVDTLVPAVHIYKKSIEQDDSLPLETLAKAVDAAERDVAFTAPIRAVKGRASFFDWRLVGHQDPGAMSTLLVPKRLLETAEEYFDGKVDHGAWAKDAIKRGE